MPHHVEVQMRLTIKTLTLLWTGGVDGKVDRIHETGILGSLRWWYEVIVRGLGGKACDPTSNDRCKYDPRDSRPPEEQLCAVCYLFGATGWRRRFRLEVVETDVSDAQIDHTISLSNRLYTDYKGNQRAPTWYFRDPTQSGEPKPNTPKQGRFIIQIQSLTPEFNSQVIAGLIQFIADWASLGARAQMGFGVIALPSGRIDTQPLYDWLIRAAGHCTYTDLPSLRNIFLARISPKNDKPFSEQDTFNLKYDLRRLFAKDKALRHFIMGTVEGERMAAKVKMSRPYNNAKEMRVWGWIPEEAKVYQGSWDRNKVVNAIYHYLKRSYNVQVWREMNASRDTVTPNNDALAFLRSLLGLREEDHAA